MNQWNTLERRMLEWSFRSRVGLCVYLLVAIAFGLLMFGAMLGIAAFVYAMTFCGPGGLDPCF